MSNIFDLIIYAASVIASVGTIIGFVIKWLDKRIDAMIAPLKNQIHKMDVKECRRFLIDFLLDVEHGVKKDTVQWKFAFDVYDHYIKELCENSYVKDKWDDVVTHGNID